MGDSISPEPARAPVRIAPADADGRSHARATTSPRAYPGMGHAVLMTIGMMALQGAFAVPVMFGVAIASGKGFSGVGSVQLTPGLLSVVNLLAISCIVLWGYAANNVSWRLLLPLTRVPWLALASVVLAGLGLTPVLSEMENVFREILPVPEKFAEMMGGAFAFVSSPWSTAILLVVVASLTEEPLFRGVILRGLLGRNRPLVAIVVSALLFGFVHANPWQFLSATSLGLVFGWYFFRTRSLVPCILGHAVNNGVAFASATLDVEIPGFSGHDLSANAHQPWWFTAAGAAVAVIGLWMFRRATSSLVPPSLPDEAMSAAVTEVASARYANGPRES